MYLIPLFGITPLCKCVQDDGHITHLPALELIVGKYANSVPHLASFK